MTIFNYTVNYIDIAIAAIFLLFAFVGYQRGILITIVNLIRTAVGFFLCFYFSMNLYEPIYNNYVRDKALAAVNDKIVTSSNVDEVIANLQEFSASLPKFMQDFFDFSSISLSSDNMAQTILDTLLEPALIVAIKVSVFVLVFLLFFITTGVIIHLIRKSFKKKEDKRGKKSVLKKSDQLFGCIFGMLKSLVIIFAVTSVLMYVINLDNSIVNENSFIAEAKNSGILHFVDSINPFNAITEELI